MKDQLIAVVLAAALSTGCATTGHEEVRIPHSRGLVSCIVPGCVPVAAGPSPLEPFFFAAIKRVGQAIEGSPSEMKSREPGIGCALNPAACILALWVNSAPKSTSLPQSQPASSPITKAAAPNVGIANGSWTRSPATVVHPPKREPKKPPISLKAKTKEAQQ